MPIRPYTPADLPALYAINQASTPGVGHVDTPEALGELIAMGTCLVLTDEADTPLGFINLVEPGTASYDSKNLRWLEQWMANEKVPDMAYVDRIALAEAARGQGHGGTLYTAAFNHMKGRGLITCEINDDPPNPGSQRFHTRLGFRRIGSARYSEDYAVGYYARAV